MRKKSVVIIALVTGVLSIGLYAMAQQRTVTLEGQKLHILPATLETTQWGWLDPKEPSKLTMKSGELVAIETMMHAHNQINPGTTMEEIVKLRLANPGGGPHSVTGPVYVEGAEPGDVMEIRIKKIVPKAFGVNFNLPGKEFPKVGGLQEFFPEGFVRYFYLDWEKKQAEFKPGITVDLQPFPGVLAVGIDPDDPSARKGGSTDKMAPVSTLRPWKNASNLDLNELQEGSILYVPVLLKGGLIWVGDAHCRQGNNEVNLTAIECAFREIVLQPIVRKDMKLKWPRAETATHWILMGFHENLDEAFKLAAKETVDFMVEKFKVTPYEAYSLTSILVDCRVTQVVDIRKGVHCMVPKKNFATK